MQMRFAICLGAALFLLGACGGKGEREKKESKGKDKAAAGMDKPDDDGFGGKFSKALELANKMRKKMMRDAAKAGGATASAADADLQNMPPITNCQEWAVLKWRLAVLKGGKMPLDKFMKYMGPGYVRFCKKFSAERRKCLFAARSEQAIRHCQSGTLGRAKATTTTTTTTAKAAPRPRPRASSRPCKQKCYRSCWAPCDKACFPRHPCDADGCSAREACQALCKSSCGRKCAGRPSC